MNLKWFVRLGEPLTMTSTAFFNTLRVNSVLRFHQRIRDAYQEIFYYVRKFIIEPMFRCPVEMQRELKYSGLKYNRFKNIHI
jgi:hypothetical protein